MRRSCWRRLLQKELRGKYRRTVVASMSKNNFHVEMKNMKIYASGGTGSGRARVFRAASCLVPDEIDIFPIPAHLIVGYHFRGIDVIQAGLVPTGLMIFFPRRRNNKFVVHLDSQDGRNWGCTLIRQVRYRRIKKPKRYEEAKSKRYTPIIKFSTS